VRRNGGRWLVWVVEGGRVEHRAVSVGPENEGRVAVTAGLRAGERVVVEGPAALAEGARVMERKL